MNLRVRSVTACSAIAAVVVEMWLTAAMEADEQDRVLEDESLVAL